jgi:hypothetical protein
MKVKVEVINELLPVGSNNNYDDFTTILVTFYNKCDGCPNMIYHHAGKVTFKQKCTPKEFKKVLRSLINTI